MVASALPRHLALCAALGLLACTAPSAPGSRDAEERGTAVTSAAPQAGPVAPSQSTPASTPGAEPGATLDARAAIPPASLALTGDGGGLAHPVCGLGAAFHAGRRAELRRRLGAGVVLVRGLPDTRDYRTFEQDKTFWYLTGVESPDAALLMDVESGLEALYLPVRDRATEAVEGERWDAEDAWVSELSGFATVKPAGALLQDLGLLLDDDDVLWISRHPTTTLAGGFDRAEPAARERRGDPLDGRTSRADALERRLVERFGVQVRNMAPQLAEMRRVKQPAELDALRRAGRTGALAMAQAIRSTRPGLGEWELAAVLEFEQRRRGARGPAYAAIVASGPNSCVLHAAANARRLGTGEILLVDAGCEVDQYTTDITRSWPVDGTFTPRMADLYDAVLAAQAAGIAAARPGASLLSVDEAASRELRRRGLGGLIRHFTCHYVGLEVHDTGALLAPLEPGVVFTIEPGVYDAEAELGIRIEDVVLITEDGCELLTRDVPVERAALEALLAEDGSL